MSEIKKWSIEEMDRLEVDAFKTAEKLPLVIVLDNIRSLHNVGAAFRTSDAFRVQHLYLCGITGTPPNRELHKSALGAEDTVDWTYHQDCLALVKELKQQGWIIAALEQASGSTSLQHYEPQPGQKICLIAGNEVFGVQEPIIEHCDLCLEIPQFGTKHSLNVSVSLGMVLWHYMLKTGLHQLQK
ncbi:MAG: RNA methyltransferase [Cytophagaceae bacterium]|jgi:tRNA G18 (ribose-2'-O)-methylase SpoU|nr:RNA methyltransferase [Cytophagaceae bacterium]